jgi:hypothetical protein
MIIKSDISLKLRIVVTLLIWSIACIIAAIFSELLVEYDGPGTMFYARLQLLIFGPLLLPFGLVWTLLDGISRDLPSRQAFMLAGTVLFFCVFISHSWYTITRKASKSFLISLLTLTGLLFASSICVLYSFKCMSNRL